MNAKRKILFRAGAIALLLLIAAAMFIIGRGHTVYLDNRAIEYNGQTYSALTRAVVFVDGKQVARLFEKERGKAICIGQNFKMTLTINKTNSSAEETISVSIPLPLNMDGIIINLPAYLAGLPKEAYLSEFTIAPDESTPDEEIVPDEDVLPED